jgi:hypothetical protein
MKEVKFDIKHVKALPHGRKQVKIHQNDISLTDMNIDGVKHKVLRSLGRGRFIVKEINTIEVSENGEPGS